MTLINFISGAVYTKNAAFREKFQLYAVASIFLVLLYNSPSGLVIYWILNNLFSLVKNIVMKTKNPQKILHIAICILLFFFNVFFFMHDGALYKKAVILILSCTVAAFPIVKKLLPEFNSSDLNKKTSILPLVLSGTGLALLAGFLLPASVIATSPIEFSFLGKTDNPLNYIWHSVFVAAGFFVFWPVCIYIMFGDKVKKWETVLLELLFFCALANAFIFKFNYGVLDTTLSLENTNVLKKISVFNKILPAVFFVLITAVLFCLEKFKRLHLVNIFMAALCIAEICAGLPKLSHISKNFKTYAQSDRLQKTEFEPVYHFTKNGKNVVVLFLDRAISTFLPYALEELPELKEQLRGFVYYPNTLSFSSVTIKASPALMGGYEYTPENLNERSTELLKDKHNEASLVMPYLFRDSGFEVTITDPPFPNYTWKGDLSAFKNLENIKASEIIGKYRSSIKKELGLDNKENQDSIVKKEIVNFSILEILPPVLRYVFYRNFRQSYSDSDSYFDNVSGLYFLNNLTDFDADKDQFIFIDNETNHCPTSISKDFITPDIDFETEDLMYKTNDQYVSDHYQVFIAGLRQVGLWFDFLRYNNIFDNTRIIIVSDHGFPLNLSDFSHFENPEIPSSYNPILLVKDFNSIGELKTDNTFMTNADTLFLATKKLNIPHINPFTKKEFKQIKESGINIYDAGTEWNAEQMVDKTQFTLNETTAFHVSENVFDKNNWIPLTEWKNKTGGDK